MYFNCVTSPACFKQPRYVFSSATDICYVQVVRIQFSRKIPLYTNLLFVQKIILSLKAKLCLLPLKIDQIFGKKLSYSLALDIQILPFKNEINSWKIIKNYLIKNCLIFGYVCTVVHLWKRISLLKQQKEMTTIKDNRLLHHFKSLKFGTLSIHFCFITTVLSNFFTKFAL